MNMIGKKLIAALLICAMMTTPLAGLAETAAPEAGVAEAAAAAGISPDCLRDIKYCFFGFFNHCCGRHFLLLR